MGLRHRHRSRYHPARPERGRHPPDFRQKERAGVAAGMAPEGLPPLAHDEGAHLGQRPLPADRLPGHHLLLRRPRPRRTAPRASTRSIRSCSKPTRSSASRLQEQEMLAGVAVDAVFDSVSVATTFKAKLEDMGIIFGSFSEAVQEHPELVQKVPRLGGAVLRQLLRGAELGGLQRRLLLLRPQGRALPHGAVHLLPHQRQGHRPVRAHPDHRRRRRLRQLPGRLHRAHARHQPVACRGGGAGGARQRPDQVLHRAELVPRRQGRQGRHLQLRHQARRVPRREFQDLLDAGGDRLRHHLEVSELPADRRQLGGRVLLGGAHQQLPAGRHRHQDDPHREEHHAARSSRRASRPATARTPTAAG